MEIYYKHKKTGSEISLKDIKEGVKIDYNYAIRFADRSSFFDPSKQYVEIERYDYLMKDIPLSDDFEVICVNNEFSKHEIYLLLKEITKEEIKPWNNDLIELSNKLKKILYEKEIK